MFRLKKNDMRIYHDETYLRTFAGDPLRIVTKQRSESTMSLIESGITADSNPDAVRLLHLDKKFHPQKKSNRNIDNSEKLKP